MNGRVAHKLRQYSKKNWLEYLNAILGWPYKARLRFAWYIANPWNKEKGK